MDNSTTCRLLSDVYDAVAVEDGWILALTAVIRAIDGDAGCLCWQPTAASPLAEIASVGLDVSAFLNRYRGEVERLNIPFYSLFRDQPAGRFVSFGTRAFEPDYRRSIFFNEWAKPLGFGDVAGCHLIRDSSLYGWLSIRRDHAKGPFPNDKMELGRALMPHLARALKLWIRLHSMQVAEYWICSPVQ